MCSRARHPALHRRAIMVALVAVVCQTSGMVGCARPRGVLFEPVASPRRWPPPPEQPRITLVGTLSGSADLKAARSAMEGLSAALRGPRPPIRFSSPHGIAIGPGGLVAVADVPGGAVHVMDLATRTHHLISGYADQKLAAPVGVAWVGDRLFVTDGRRHEVIEFGADGSYRRRFGHSELERPVGLAYVPGREQLYVVDGGAHRICVFDLSGSLIGTFGQRGAQPGRYNFPTHIVCRGERLLVADSGNFRVQLLDLDGRCIRTIGNKGDGAGDLPLPKGVAFDRSGHIYVVDARFENVQVFDESGRLLMAFGEEGNGPGEFSLPTGLAIDGEDRVWVADSGNRRLQVFKYIGTS